MAKMASGDLSLTSTSSQEEESAEYVGYDRTLRPNSNSSGSTSAANMANANNATLVVTNAHVGVVSNASNNNSTVIKYDVIKNQYDSALVELNTLRHQHADTMRRCDDLANQLAFYQEQYMAAINQLKSSNSTQNNAYYYNDNGMTAHRQKCAGHCVESQKLLEELQLCKAEREKYKKNLNVALVDLDNIKIYRSQQTNKYKRIEQELHQLLSEKDNVLQEHQKMFDDLAAANKELERHKKEEQLYKSEIKALQQANNELKKRDLLKSSESSWSKEFSDSKDDFKEIEKLRKSLEKAQGEVERAQQDTEEAKRVRDWAISQREKIVQERDSVKTLCDKLRKERDRAISDLLSAIRDSEKIKKQKDEAQKKIDALKEQIENQNLDNASRRSFPTTMGSGSYEAEDSLDIELVNYYADSDIGIILDDSNNRQLVCGVTNMSPAFGKLKINDVIIKVNNVECANLSKRLVLEQIRSSAPRCSLLISRTRHSKHHFYTVQLNLQNDTKHGLSLDSGVFISKIDSDSLAAFEPELDVGDRVLSINNKYVQRLDEALSLLNDERNETISIFALKSVQESGSGSGYNDTQRRMTTSSAQTDSIDSMHRVTSAKHPSKIAEMLSKFKEKMHISKPGSDADHFAEQNDAIEMLDSVLSGESSMEKNKRSKRSKKEKEAAAKSMGTWPRTSILNATIENPSSTIVQREKKRPTLALFTAGPINIDKDDERDVCDEPAPPLPPPSKSQQLANMRQANGMAIKQNPNRNSNPIPTSMFFQNLNNGAASSNQQQQQQSSYASYPRNSMYCGQAPAIESTTQQEVLARNAAAGALLSANVRVKLPNNTHKYEQRANNYQNRYSYIAPTEYYAYKTSGQQAQAQQQVLNNVSGSNNMQHNTEFSSRKQQLFDMFHSNSNKNTPTQTALFAPLPSNYTRGTQQHNSLDIISLKSQNSIDSILSSKSPPISEYAISNYVKRPTAHAAMQHVPTQQTTLPTNNSKNVAKYPSDSESIASGIGMPAGLLHFHNNNSNGNAPNTGIGNRSTQFFPSLPPYSSSHAHGMRQIRHNSPLTLPSTPSQLSTANATAHAQQLDAANSSALGIPSSSVDKFDLDYAAQATAHNMHAHSYVHEFHHTPAAPTLAHYLPHHMTGGSGVYEGGTFPRKKEQRLRIPSNPSVTSKNSGVKNSSGSIDHHYAAIGGAGCGSTGGVAVGVLTSQQTTATVMPIAHHAALSNTAANGSGGGGGGGSSCGSPIPHVHVEVLSHGGSKRNSNVPADFLCPGDLRRVTIDKSDKSLGITIQCNENGGGIFVATVVDKSIATRAGLQVGDQLLEVCGLNMRSATNDIAANVLRQCGNSITMLVQYNPEKFHSAEYEGSNNLEPESPVNHSGSPTPRNSPRPPLRNLMAPLPALPLPPNTASNQLTTNTTVVMPPLAQSIKDHSFADSLENQSDMSSSQDIPSSAATTTTASTTSTVYEEEARFVTLHMDKSKNLGIKLFGGNQVGIFVHDVHAGSPSDRAGIRKGDQILEYNGVDLRCVTAEQAATEISKLTDTVTMLVQNKLKKLKQIKDKESGDSFYIRVGFDRTGDLNDGDLRFVKDEVLYVDNTVFNGTFGLWRAWKLDAKGHRKECGIIPSQIKVEEELRSGEVVDCEAGNARRGSTSARRSFFRRKKHQRSSSRDSTEIASFSNTQLSFFPDSGILNDEGSLLSYQRVERLDSPVRRPVLIIGPLSECVMDRLTMDFSNLFKLCEVTAMDCSQDAMEEGLQENIFVDYRRRGNKFECTTVESINNACKNDRRHCILDISISAVERLQRLQIYPIVLLLRFKSAKQIREIRDFGTDKISAKAAKEMYERALKLESDYKQYISAVIPGVSIKHMCTQIKDSVDKEQDKLLWVPVSS